MYLHFQIAMFQTEEDIPTFPLKDASLYPYTMNLYLPMCTFMHACSPARQCLCYSFLSVVPLRQMFTESNFQRQSIF